MVIEGVTSTEIRFVPAALELVTWRSMVRYNLAVYYNGKPYTAKGSFYNS
jgi:hypothetical protein